MGYTRDAVKGVSWISLLRVLTRGITFVRLSILGRLLTPTQFGYFGVASLFLSLLEILTETGINVFFIQEKRDVKEYINAAWVVSIIRGTVLASLIALYAHIIATFFKAQGAYTVILLTALVPFIRGFINPAIITFQKELLFRKEFTLRFVLFVVDAAVAIVAAFLTRTAESFVYGLIASAVLEVVLSYTLIPLWPKLRFESQKIKTVFHKSWWVTVIGIQAYFADNGDNITVGKIAGLSSLGIYQIAYKFSTLPISEVTNVVNQVTFPVYTKFSDDKARLQRAFAKVTLVSSVTALVFGSLIYLLAKPIILIFMGDQWLLAIPAIQVLAVYGILRTVFGNFAPVFLSVGRQDYVAKMTFFRVLGLAISVIPLVQRFGMVGAGYAMLLSILVEVPVILYFYNRIFKKRSGI